MIFTTTLHAADREKCLTWQSLNQPKTGSREPPRGLDTVRFLLEASY